MKEPGTTASISGKLNDISTGRAAVIAGIALILMTVLGPFANFSVLLGLLVPDDAAKTVANIMASGEKFRIGIACFLFVAVLDVIVAWALYVFLKPANKSISLLAAWFRIVYAAMLAVILVYLLEVLQLTGDGSYLSAFDQSQINAQVMLALNNFSTGWQFSLIIFGIHLLLLGHLFFWSDYTPRYLGVLLAIAGLGYMTDGLGKTLVPGYDLTVAMFTFIGEVVLVFWLLIKGRKIIL